MRCAALRGPHAALAVDLQSECLDTWLPNTDIVSGRAISSNSLSENALSRFAQDLTHEFLADAPLSPAMLLDQIGALLALTLGAVAQPSPSIDAMRVRIHALIQERCLEAHFLALSLWPTTCPYPFTTFMRPC